MSFDTQSDHGFRLFLEAVKDYAIFMLSRDGIIRSWNAGAQRIKGYSADEIVGQHFSRFYPADDLAAGKPQHALATAAREGRYEDEGWRLRKDGTRFWAQVTITAVTDEQGHLVGFGKVTRDVTERRQLLEAERRARIAAEDASRAKDEFLATVSHELRTPLNVILGEIWRLRSGTLEGAAAARALDALDRNARLQLRLLEDLLDVARISVGKLRIDPQSVDLAGLGDDALEFVRPAAELKGILLRNEVDPATGPILGDALRLHQVAWNLLSNAIKFTPAGGIVTLTVAREGTAAVLRVADTGIGIEPELLPRIFDRFTQGDASTTRSEPGLGLGLALVRYLVEAHGGTIRAKSDGSGRGATFEVCLPVPAVLPATIAPHPSRTLRLDDIRVLLVDDQPDALESAGGILQQFGATVRCAGSVSEALDLVRDFRPDVVLADIAMPGRDGYDLIAEVRAMDDENARNVPAAALTAYSTITDRLKIIRAGYQLHVPKPVQPLDLALTVQELARKVRDVLSSQHPIQGPD